MNLASFLHDVSLRLHDHPALTDQRVSWTYGEFAKRSAAIGSSLRSRGLERGDRVVLSMENCAEFFEVLFGCWTAGLCAVPVNAKLHHKEVEHIIRDSGGRLLIATPGLANSLAHLPEAVETLGGMICTETPDYERLTQAGPMVPVAAEPRDRAWIFYTSGTTGRPKGAILSHRNLLFMCYAYYADIDMLDHRDVKLHVGPLSHGSGLYSLPQVLKGGHHIIHPGFDPSAIADILDRHNNVTMFNAPTMLTRLVHSPVTARMRIENLKTIYYGGGPMYVADLERALSIFGPRLYQLYGQGEAPMTITGLSKAMHSNPRSTDDWRTCGVPRTGVSVRVVDDDDQDLPPGETGEVLSRSDCVMEGYWNNPEATKATLRGGWLHTGDLGSLDAQKYLTLRDRSKDMIISGGSNIYPREVEEVLLRHPDVLETSIVGRPHPDWGEEVVAFVVIRPGSLVPAATLDALCLNHIARFKRPKDYRFVESLPKNNYGKVLKTELREKLKAEERKR
jgi:acyl-CoA synthetase (AMP-forming)/AMP-acid ligase II